MVEFTYIYGRIYLHLWYLWYYLPTFMVYLATFMVYLATFMV